MAATITKINTINQIGQMDATLFTNSKKRQHNNANNRHHNKVNTTIKAAEEDVGQLKDAGK
eukprot:10265627-Ditylum_brightwellii.AAC.1